MQFSPQLAERTVRVIWIRHGETADNARHIIQGHIDTPLNEAGIKQSKATKHLLKDVKIDVCFTSDLQRARTTAEIILEDYHPDTPLVVDGRIKEKYLGLMEGQTYYCNRTPEVMASIEPLEVFTNRLLHFWDELFPPTSAYTNGSSASSHTNHHNSQSPNQYHSQAKEQAQYPTPSTSSSPQHPPLLPSQPKDLTILIVTHGGPIKVAFSALPNQRKHIVWERDTLNKAKEVKFKVWNCSISEIVMTKVRADLSAGQPLSGWIGMINKYADIQHLLVESAAPKEGTEADADISNDNAAPTPPEAERAEAERQYHLDNAVPWWQQTKQEQENGQWPQQQQHHQ